MQIENSGEVHPNFNVAHRAVAKNDPFDACAAYEVILVLCEDAGPAGLAVAGRS